MSEVIELPVAVRRGDRWMRVGTAQAHHGNMPRVGDHVLIDTVALVIEVVIGARTARCLCSWWTLACGTMRERR